MSDQATQSEPLPKVVVIGAGPAGIRAAECLVRHGIRPIIISEAPAAGGQIYRRQPPGFTRTSAKLYGSEAGKADDLHCTFDSLADRIEFRPGTMVWNIADKMLYLETEGRVSTQEFDKLVLATGAMDRVLPMPGWTLPGVFTLGGAQIALKYQACAIGDRICFIGTGPLLYLVAYQYLKAGASVAAVLDTSTLARKASGLGQMAANPRATAYGFYYMAQLQLHGVELRHGVIPIEILGDDHVQGVRYQHGGRARTVACSAVGLGYGVKPESQLADLAGCRLGFDRSEEVWTILHDGEGRAGGDVYVAGDCVAIGGADVAELAGELAAHSLLADMGVETPARRRAEVAGGLARHARFRRGLNRAFPFPGHLVADLPDNTIVCRCESVRIGDLNQVMADLGAAEVNRLKAFSRAGMGRCQGRVCGPAVAQYLAHATGRPVEDVGRFRGQGPIKPLAYTAAATGAEPGHAFPLSEREGQP